MADRPTSPGSSAFPTFLDHDPFPSANNGRPVSTTSSWTDDATSQPELPSDTVPSQQISSRTSGAPGSPFRRGFGMFGGRQSTGSRPASSASPTHVPIAASSFFRPMSPLKLQAQRGQNIQPTGSRGQNIETAEEEAETIDSRAARHNRAYSDASVHTLKRPAGNTGPSQGASFVPSSRGGYSVVSSAGDAQPDGSVVSTAPLHQRTQQQEVHKMDRIDGTPPLNTAQRPFEQMSRNSSAQEKGAPKTPQDLSSNSSAPLEKPSASPAKSNLGKNYQYFAGNMLFLCSGRLLNTRANPLNVVTFILCVLPAILFFIFSAPWLWNNVSPAIPIIFAYIFLITASSFLHAAFSDPGILPRNLHPLPPNPEEERNPLAIGPPTTEWVMVKTFTSKNHTESTAEQGMTPESGGTTAMEVPTKYCKTCNIWRPPRAHHCRVCDACMETQDHHCVWLNNCVGRRNYRFFFAFVGFGSVMAIALLAFSIVHVAAYASDNDTSFGSALSGRTQERVAFALLIYSLVALPYPGSLFIYHLFLVARGETTREYLNGHKFTRADRHRPFSQSSVPMNWAAVLGRPRPPSYMSFKKPYQEGDLRLGHTVDVKTRNATAKRALKEQNGRVKGLKQRFSVTKKPSRGEGIGGQEYQVEMKSLNNGESNATTTTTKKSSKLNRMDSTPR